MKILILAMVLALASLVEGTLRCNGKIEKVVIDFERDYRGHRLRQGSVPSALPRGIFVLAVRSDESEIPSSGRDQVILNSANPPAGDQDLTTKDENMVLIINSSDNTQQPNDNRHGGTFYFQFSEQIFRIDSIVMLDMDGYRKKRSYITGISQFAEPFPRTVIPFGENGQKTIVNLGYTFINPGTMEVHLAESGAIVKMNLSICTEELCVEEFGDCNPNAPGNQCCDGLTCFKKKDGTGACGNPMCAELGDYCQSFGSGCCGGFDHVCRGDSFDQLPDGADGICDLLVPINDDFLPKDPGNGSVSKKKPKCLKSTEPCKKYAGAPPCCPGLVCRFGRFTKKRRYCLRPRAKCIRHGAKCGPGVPGKCCNKLHCRFDKKRSRKACLGRL